LSRLAEEGEAAFARRESEVSRKRLGWWEENRERLAPTLEHLPVLDRAYQIFYLEYLGLDPKEVPIVERSEKRLLIRSYNFCPVHHACARIGLDTRNVCQDVYEGPVNDLLQQIHPHLRFGRNYDAIRPHALFCEEYIELVD
jgi:hypothetical protein